MKVINNYNLYEFESKSEFERNIKDHQITLVNDNCVDPKKFYGISADTVDNIFIGIVGEQHGIEPSLQIIDTENYIVISIDEKVYCLELKNHELIWMKEFDSIVYEILKAPDFSLLILSELGVVCLTYSGTKLWEHMSDVITDFRLESNSLRVSTDEEEYSILLKNGSVFK